MSLFGSRQLSESLIGNFLNLFSKTVGLAFTLPMVENNIWTNSFGGYLAL
jgi:hypothetical protein